MKTKVIDIDATNFEAEVISSELPVLVDFWAPWCGPCRMMSPVLDELSEIMDGQIRVVKVNVEDPANRDIAMTYEIRSIPNMKVFKSGVVIHEFVGLTDAKTLSTTLSRVIA